jgi:hypothetical protein
MMGGVVARPSPPLLVALVYVWPAVPIVVGPSSSERVGIAGIAGSAHFGVYRGHGQVGTLNDGLKVRMLPGWVHEHLGEHPIQHEL